ncbi:MAG: c-type cytochrome [Bacteroidetes bacterium]|nr:c-type cytochrome [Bacteroidota bacterium]
MKKAIILILVISGFIWAVSSCSSAKEDQAGASAAPSKDSLVRRGNYLVTSMGCNDCHSPKKMGPNGPFVDTARTLSGFRSDAPVPTASPEDVEKHQIVFAGDLTGFVGPWGTSFAANITSDGTGIGNWSLDQFKNAIRNGKYMGLKEERNLMPPMPWEAYRNLNDADLEAIFAYLKSTKPVKNVVPSYRPPGK